MQLPILIEDQSAKGIRDISYFPSFITACNFTFTLNYGITFQLFKSY